MTIAQFNSEGDGQGNDQGFKAPSPQDHVAQGVKILETALELAKAGFRVFPVHGLRWVRVVSPVGLATAVPGGDIRLDNENEEDGETELEVRWRVEIRCTCGVVSCANIGKHPVGHLVPHGSKEARTDLLQVEAWFRLPGSRAGEQDGARALTAAEQGWVPWNLAVATGEGLVVIDAESKQLHATLPTGLDVLDEWETWTRGTSLPVAAGQWNSVVVIKEDGSISVETTGDLTPVPGGEPGEVQREGYWPGTLRVRTGSGGLHVYVRVNENLRIKSRNRVLPAVDIKADGGYVLAPPSRHASGGVYTVSEGRWSAIASAAEDLVGWLLTVKGGRFAVRRMGETHAGANQISGYDFTEIIVGPGCPAGFRDYFVNDLCFRLRRAGTPLEEAASALRKEWSRMEQPADAFYDWHTCLYKLRRVWEEVTPEDVTDLPAWRPPGQGQQLPAVQTRALPTNAAAASGSGEVYIVQATGVPAGPLVEVGEDGEVSIGPGSAWQLLGRRDLTMQLSDTGNAKRFAQRMREMVRYCADEQTWYIWDNTRWAPDILNESLKLTEEIIKDLYAEAQHPTLDDDTRNAVLRWAASSESEARRKSMLSLARVEPKIAIAAKSLDIDPWQLVVRNGTIDLETGQLRESRAEDLNTKCAQVSFDASAVCPLWLSHIKFVTKGDEALARWLQRAVGYTLTGSVLEQKLFFLWGDGANGKSTFVDVIAHLLGDYATAADENLLSGGESEHPTQLADLRGRRLVFADETDAQKKLREQRIKSLTGSNTVKARYMRQNYFMYTPQFKIWLMGNHKPQILGADEGIWRRLKLVPFSNTLTDDLKVPGFDEQLFAELPGILNWALDGLKTWHQLGKQIGEVAEVSKATREYRAEENVIDQVVSDLLTVTKSEDDFFVTGEFYRLYKAWCDDNGVKEVKSAIAIGRELAKRGLVSDQKWTAGIGNQKVWKGARLRQVNDRV